ncbi:MAG: L-lactate permease [Woeseiaceae bacterium]|nr:L-lactate permease [Woeseiaceae bacterium]
MSTDLIVAVLPIAVLIWLMTKSEALASHRALPLVALMTYAAKLLWFADDPNLVNATVVQGLMEAWTPILIIWGAILLFKVMDASGAMTTVRGWLNGISPNPVAQLMIIGWAFSFMIEGASGFGTPAALAAPILVGLGFAPFKVAVLALIMNSVPVSFGAVGTPTWFGLGQLGLTEAEIMAVSYSTALIHAAAALVIPVIALSYVIPASKIRANLIYVYITILGCVLPYVLLARYSYEFPSLIAGMIGLVVAIFAARLGLGLEQTTDGDRPSRVAAVPAGKLIRALFPIWATVLVLVVTRIEQLGIKGALTDSTPLAGLPLGSLGELGVTQSLAIELSGIFGSDIAWTFQTLYVPAFIPFLLVVLVSIPVLRMPVADFGAVWTDTARRMINTILALLGALVMVKLLMLGGETSMVVLIGDAFATATGQSWQYLAPYLGALGSFFSGSATISNLTFAGIQVSVARELGLDQTLILSLQSVGAAMGNMVCINNIVAVCSILGVAKQEGAILKRTIWPMLLYGVIAGIVGQLLVNL